jgi:flavin-dependent dehydrogenase
MTLECDVVVIGGGPAGSTAAAWLARAGRRVMLFERDQFPRFHIGESLLASVNEVLDAIGAAELVRSAGFPRKWGATFITPDGSIERFADFATADEVPQPQAWQVPRATFDELLLRHAGRCGAQVHERHRVTAVAFEPHGVTVTVLPSPDPAALPTDAPSPPARRVRARAVVDASGRASLLALRFALRKHEPDLANVAIFSHFAGVPRTAGRRAGDIRVIARADLGWYWLIPISDDMTSVGVVLPRDSFKALPRADPQVLLDRLIGETAAVARLMTHAERRWPVRIERDFSYGARTYAGDRWIVVGDAGSFLDPVFSSGVAIAMESGLEGAQAIESGLAQGDLSARRLALFNRRQRQRYRSFRRFVRGFYTAAFRDLFFNPDPPEAMFRAVVTVLAGYWRPSPLTRLWIVRFFRAVRRQQRTQFARSHLGAAAGSSG